MMEWKVAREKLDKGGHMMNSDAFFDQQIGWQPALLHKTTYAEHRYDEESKPTLATRAMTSEEH